MGRRGLYCALNSDSEELLQPPFHTSTVMENREENTNSVSHPLPPPPNPTDPVSLSLSLTHTHRHPSQEKLSSEGGEGQILLLPSVLKNLSGETVAAEAQVTNDKQGSSRSRGKNAGDGNKWGFLFSYFPPSQAH